MDGGRSLVVNIDDMDIQRPNLEVGDNDLEAKDNDEEEVPIQQDTNDTNIKGESRHMDIESEEVDSIPHTQSPTTILTFPSCKNKVLDFASSSQARKRIHVTLYEVEEHEEAAKEQEIVDEKKDEHEEANEEINKDEDEAHNGIHLKEVHNHCFWRKAGTIFRILILPIPLNMVLPTCNK